MFNIVSNLLSCEHIFPLTKVNLKREKKLFSIDGLAIPIYITVFLLNTPWHMSFTQHTQKSSLDPRPDCHFSKIHLNPTHPTFSDQNVFRSIFCLFVICLNGHNVIRICRKRTSKFCLQTNCPFCCSRYCNTITLYTLLTKWEKKNQNDAINLQT